MSEHIEEADNKYRVPEPGAAIPAKDITPKGIVGPPGYSKKIMARPAGTTITTPKDNNVNIKPLPPGAGGKDGTRQWSQFSGPNGPKDSDHDGDRPGPRMGRGPGRRGK